MYEKSFSCADLDFKEVGYRCPSLVGVYESVAKQYRREIDAENLIAAHSADDLRQAIAQAMCDGLDDFIASHADADPGMIIIADAIKTTNVDDEVELRACGFTIRSEKQVTLSIAREVFASFDVDELEANIENEFLDAIIMRIKKAPRTASAAKPSASSATGLASHVDDASLRAMVEAFAVPSKPEEVQEVEAVEVEVDEPIDEQPTESVPSPEKESDEKPAEPSCPIVNLEDPDGLWNTYKAHFADIASVSDIANAPRNVMSRDGNYIVLTSTIVKEEGYKLETVTRYDAKNKGKSCRTTENDGNKTTVYSWRTPSLYGWALSTLPDDGGDFESEVLSKSLVEKGAGSCKAHGIRFIATPKEVRNANRGNNGANGGSEAKPKPQPSIVSVPSPSHEEASVEVAATPQPYIPTDGVMGDWWMCEADEGAIYTYISNIYADRCNVYEYYGGEIVCEEHQVHGEGGAIDVFTREYTHIDSIDDVPSDVIKGISEFIELGVGEFKEPIEPTQEVETAEPEAIEPTEDNETEVAEPIEATANPKDVIMQAIWNGELSVYDCGDTRIEGNIEKYQTELLAIGTQQKEDGLWLLPDDKDFDDYFMHTLERDAKIREEKAAARIREREEARQRAAEEEARRKEQERIERERKEREEEERLAREESERKEREEAERLAREEAERKAAEEAEARRKEELRKEAERTKAEEDAARRGARLNPHRRTVEGADAEWSKQTIAFIEKFETDASFRDEVLRMVEGRNSDAERAKAEEEARQRRNKGRARHKQYDRVMRRLRHNKPAWLWGEAGTGKNVLAEQCADGLGIPFAPINCLFEKFEVTGFARPDGTLQETTIYLAVKFGWLLFWDEADTSSPMAANVMNSLLANGYIDFPVVGRVYAHPNFRCIAAGNTNGRGGNSDYTGRTTIDAATLNRFLPIEVDYDYDVEVAIAKRRGYGEDVADFIEDFRQAVRDCSLRHIVSYRQLDDLCDSLDDGLSVEDAIREAVIRDMKFDDFKIVCHQLQKAGNRFSDCCKRTMSERKAFAC